MALSPVRPRFCAGTEKYSARPHEFQRIFETDELLPEDPTDEYLLESGLGRI